MDAVYEWLQTIGTVLNRTTEAEKLAELENKAIINFYNKLLLIFQIKTIFLL